MSASLPIAPGTSTDACPPDMLMTLGASTDPDINAHIVADAAHPLLQNHCLMHYMQQNQTVCLREALLVAYVFNNGLVMCSGGMDEAVHVERMPPRAAEPAQPAPSEIDLLSFEQELDALSED